MYQVRMYLVMARKYPRKGKGYYGYRLETFTQSGKLHVKEEYACEVDITANQLALVAMYRAFEELKKPCEVEVFTDSLYLRGNYERNLGDWILNEWRNSKGEPVANKELWQEIERITAPHAVQFSTAYQYPARAAMVNKVQKMKLERLEERGS